MKRVLSTVASVLLASNIAYADADAVANIATDGTGEFLIAPAFLAQDAGSTAGKQTTSFKLINTDGDSSLIYRVSVRGYVCSQEFDFPIVLSPGDVLTFDIGSDENGQYIMNTDEDMSVYSETALPYNQKVYFKDTHGSIDYSRGYVEFYPIAQINHSTVDDTVLSMAPVAKADIRAVFDTLASGTIPANVVAVDDEDLMGTVTIKSEGGVNDYAMTIDMLAFEDVAVNTPVTGQAISSTVNTVVTNYLLNGTTDIDTLLTVNNFVIPYTNRGTNETQMITFWYDLDCNQERSFNALIRDNAENTATVSQDFSGVAQQSPTLSNEVSMQAVSNYVNITSNSYTDGWINVYNFTNTKGNQLTRGLTTPSAIPTMFTATEVNGKYYTNWLYNSVK